MYIHKTKTTYRQGVGGGHILAFTGNLYHTRGEVIPFVPDLSLAVQLFLSKFVQQSLILMCCDVMRWSCPLLGKLCSAANTVTLTVLGEEIKDTSNKTHFKPTDMATAYILHIKISNELPAVLIPLLYLRCSCCDLCSSCAGSWQSCSGRPGWFVQRPCGQP